MSSTEKSNAPAHPSTEEHNHQDHPHACLNGYVYLGYTVVDEESGEEAERVEALPCRCCAEGENVRTILGRGSTGLRPLS